MIHRNKIEKTFYLLRPIFPASVIIFNKISEARPLQNYTPQFLSSKSNLYYFKSIFLGVFDTVSILDDLMV